MLGQSSLQQAMRQIDKAETEEEFERAVCALRSYLKSIEVDNECLIEVEKRAYYLSNSYSSKDTKEKLEQAKKRVQNYIDELMSDAQKDNQLLNILDNFYLFLEELLERDPHKKAGIQKAQLEILRIKNEYDIQHLLFAYIRPLYPMARAEVSEDTGYNTVRVDIALDTKSVIEVKCTRKGMTQKKLVEEIEADMVHYSAKCLYFFIYDKEKIIKNPLNFKSIYEKKIADKQVYIVIHQPKIL